MKKPTLLEATIAVLVVGVVLIASIYFAADKILESHFKPVPAPSASPSSCVLPPFSCDCGGGR